MEEWHILEVRQDKKHKKMISTEVFKWCYNLQLHTRVIRLIKTTSYKWCRAKFWPIFFGMKTQYLSRRATTPRRNAGRGDVLVGGGFVIHIFTLNITTINIIAPNIITLHRYHHPKYHYPKYHYPIYHHPKYHHPKYHRLKYHHHNQQH